MKPGLRVAALVVLTGTAAVAGGTARIDLSDAIEGAHRDVRAAVDDLAEQRDRIAGQRRPLAAQAEGLHREVADLRRDVRGRQQEQARRAADLERLDAEISAREADLATVEQALSEYRRATETRMHRAESLARADALSELDTRLSADDRLAQLPAAVEAMGAAALEWAAQRVGGMHWEGECLDPDGLRLHGRYLSAGPAVWFVEEHGAQAGLAVTRPGSALPSLAPRQPARFAAAYRDAVRGEEATLPVDPGDALRRIEARTGWLAQARAGGAVMIPLLVLAAVALFLAVAKTWSLSRVHVDGRAQIPALLEALRNGDKPKARAAAVGAGFPLRDVLIEGVEHAETDRANLEELLHERVLSALPVLERHLGTLAVLGGVAPLLGLLGTVTGMIHTFQLITLFGTGDARLLSGGISEALVTTQFGLFIAIPTLLAHAYLVRRVRDLVGRLEDAAVAFVHGLKGKG